MLAFSENRLTEENSAPIVEIEEKTQIYHNTSLRGRTESKIRFALLVNRAVKLAKSTAQPFDHMSGIEETKRGSSAAVTFGREWT